MPKISHPLSESERILFHANYKYMWDKISTTYFAVLRSKTPPSAKIDEKKLPSYAICAKCNNDESYAPSRATIAKIVDFYNSQIRPPVEVYQFTHERLEDSDNIRYRSSSVFDPRFIGTYRGYYPSVTEDVVIGSYLIIFEEDARLKATLIMGLCSDREMKGTRLRALLSEERITYPKFREFHRNLPASRQRYSYYEGIVELTNSSLTICFHSSDMDQKKLILTLNLTGFHPSDPDREYLGGLAFALGTSDGPFDSRFFEMGLVQHFALLLFGFKGPVSPHHTKGKKPHCIASIKSRYGLVCIFLKAQRSKFLLTSSSPLFHSFCYWALYEVLLVLLQKETTPAQNVIRGG